MIETSVTINLNETLENAKLSRNAIAVEGKIRPATISELCNGKSKSISFETLIKIINALNSLCPEKRHTIEDVISVNYNN